MEMAQPQAPPRPPAETIAPSGAAEAAAGGEPAGKVAPGQSLCKGVEERARSESSVSAGILISHLHPHLDKDGKLQFSSVLERFKKNEIGRKDFVRLLKGMVDEHLLKVAINRAVEEQKAQTRPAMISREDSVQDQPNSQFPLQISDVTSSNGQDIMDRTSMNESLAIAPKVEPSTETGPVCGENKPPVPKEEAVCALEAPGLRTNQVNVKQENGVSLSSLSFGNVNQGGLHSNQVKVKQENGVSLSSPSLGNGSLYAVNQGGQLDNNSKNLSLFSSQSANSNVPAVTSSSVKRPFHNAWASSPLSKKQKISGASQDPTIEHLNDVTAVSGVNLQEEERNLFAVFNKGSGALDATRTFQKEEERLILQKGPLQKKISDIIKECGIDRATSDVEHCLSLCVEERLRKLINEMIRQSKKRVDIEQLRHRNGIQWTSDVKHQIMVMNRKAKDALNKKRADEAEKQRRSNEAEEDQGSETVKGRFDGRVKSSKMKVNKEDDKMRANAANFAARAAIGGDDVLSKWQLMAERARQKSDGAVSLSASPRSPEKNLEFVGRGLVTTAKPGGREKIGRSSPVVLPEKIVRTISVKDVISVIERDPQMARSTFLYCVYGRLHSRNGTYG